MEEILMTMFAESVYIIENLMIFCGYAIITEYKGENIKLGIVIQALFTYVFQKITSNIDLNLTGSVVHSTIINVIAGLIIGCIFYKGRFLKKCSVFMVYMGPAFIGEFITYQLLLNIAERNNILETEVSVYFSMPEYRNIGIIFCGQVILICWGGIMLFWKLVEEHRLIKECFLYLLLPVYQILIFIIYFSFCGKIRFENVMIGWLLFLFGIIIDVSVIYLINGIFKKLKVEREISEVQEKRQEELAYYMMVNDKLEQSRFLRHEFANQMQVIYGLLETKDTEKVKQMLDRTREKVEQTFGSE